MIESIKSFFISAKNDIDLLLLGLLVFVLPFERLPSKDVFGITVRASLIIGGLLIVRVIYLLVTKKLKPRWSWLNMVIALFVAWVFLIIPESINLKRGLQIAVFDAYTISIGVAFSLVFKKEYLQKLIALLVCSALLVSVFAVYQFFGDVIGLPSYLTGIQERYNSSLFGFPRVQAASLEPLYFGSYLLLPIFTVFALYVSGNNQLISRRFQIGLIILFSTIVFMTVARGAIFGLLLGFVVLAAIALIKKMASFKRVVMLLGMIIISFGLSYLMINYASKLPVDISKTFGKKGGAAFTQQLTSTGLEGPGDERAIARAKALKILNENKSAYILGIGPGQYGPYVANNQPEFYGWPIVNNLTLELLVETGIVGLGLIIVFFAGLVYRGWLSISDSRQVELVSVATLGLMAYFASQALQLQTFSSLYIMHIWVAAGLLLALVGTSKLRKS